MKSRLRIWNVKDEDESPVCRTCNTQERILKAHFYLVGRNPRALRRDLCSYEPAAWTNPDWGNP